MTITAKNTKTAIAGPISSAEFAEFFEKHAPENCTIAYVTLMNDEVFSYFPSVLGDIPHRKLFNELVKSAS